MWHRSEKDEVISLWCKPGSNFDQSCSSKMSIFCQNIFLGRQVVNLRSIHRLWSSSRPQILYDFLQQSVSSRFSPVNRISLLSLQKQQQKFFTTSALSFKTVQDKIKLPFAVDERSIKEDILIYSYNNDRFYKLLTFFGIVQFFFWLHLAGFSYSTLRDVDPLIERQKKVIGEKSSWWKRINLGEAKYRYSMAVLCISVGR